jgi:hypothetical protein
MPLKFNYRLFAVLDAINIIILTKQLVELNFESIPNETFSQIKLGLLLLVYLLLFASTIGLWMLKKWGAIAYYFQFPFRLVVWVFSFGFISLLINITAEDIFNWMFRILMILEFMRLYFTVRLQRRYHL